MFCWCKICLVSDVFQFCPKFVSNEINCVPKLYKCTCTVCLKFKHLYFFPAFILQVQNVMYFFVHKFEKMALRPSLILWSTRRKLKKRLLEVSQLLVSLPNIKPICAHFRYPQIYSSCVATNIKVETFLFHSLLTWRGQVTRYLLWNRESENN